MHSKNNNNKSHNFLQGLRPFSSSIPKTLKKYLKKGGYNYSNIVDNWTKMVSQEISNICYPISIKMGKEMREGTLILNVLHGKELEIEYKKKEILDKINNFFGYNCIGKVTLKIIQEKIEFKKNQFPKINDISKINDKMDKVKDNKLKSSLNNFLKAFNERNE
tara:strand:+ start:4520 stop:5008 length:489 start_codon:yes stop_codon:yes gene_type:complete